MWTVEYQRGIFYREACTALIFYFLYVWVAIVAENAAPFELMRKGHFLAGFNFFISTLFAFLLPQLFFCSVCNENDLAIKGLSGIFTDWINFSSVLPTS